jgi:DNA-binding NtrC family response regulator
MSPARLSLVVVRGAAVGARLRLDGNPRVVGRANDADLVLPDAHVSRKHARVSDAGDGRARVEVCDGAKPLVVNGAPQREATIAAGEGFVLGETALVVVEDDDAAVDRAPDPAHHTDVRTLMTGVSADVRGLATVMELVDALDAAGDEAAVVDALRTWAQEHLGATDAKLERSDADPALRAADGHPRPVVDRRAPGDGATLLSAPVHGVDLAWLTFTCGARRDRVTSTMRRLAAVAGRIAAVALARVESARRAEEAREALRRVSLGSARSFLGESPAAVEVARLVPRLAASDAVVLLEGETGVGKTFLARLIHEGGPRAKEPLRVINCAAIPDTLIESELFGHERGAFTGAAVARAGALESAGRGTLLLDEIGELPLASQAKLLRVLEEKRFERLGSNHAIKLEARVLVATNRDLAAMVDEGTFRQDLYYRVSVVKLRVPPLRERGNDLRLLAERVLADLAPQAGRRVDGFSPAALDVIARYSWPGNVRELKNAIERALVVGDGRLIEPGDLPETVHGAPPPQPADESLVRLPAKIEWLEMRAIEAALRATRGNQTQAAAILGVSRNTLRRKLSEAGGGGA